MSIVCGYLSVLVAFDQVSALTEYQLRISYACETAKSVYMYVAGESETHKAPYDGQELQEWAKKTAHLAGGIGYYLSAIEKLILGGCVAGEPLVAVYCKMIYNPDVANPWILRLRCGLGP
ncbi:hypothetical protein QBC38DRAFT_460669 [Podospora fimiseda]|uniref:Uncharacterized protein n=1 Tax=Podospora fimiseda TaxID=252190 RepID=A0AAN6YMV8_9PEZI|nr:hypothetical protein QBC38DRAFT_460669 [Podospora fimiseda]